MKKILSMMVLAALVLLVNCTTFADPLGNIADEINQSWKPISTSEQFRDITVKVRSEKGVDYYAYRQHLLDNAQAITDNIPIGIVFDFIFKDKKTAEIYQRKYHLKFIPLQGYIDIDLTWFRLDTSLINKIGFYGLHNQSMQKTLGEGMTFSQWKEFQDMVHDGLKTAMEEDKKENRR
jgi:hypothetical protein